MRFYVPVYVLISLFIFGCGPVQTDQKIEIKKSPQVSFDDLVESTPICDFPLIINCGFDTIIKKDALSNINEPFITNNLKAVYQIPTHQKHKLLLLADQNLSPYLYSFDSLGTKIDSLFLLTNSCIQLPHIEFSTASVIDENLHIKMETSVNFFSYISNFTGGKTKALDSSKTSIKIIQLDTVGHFNEVDTKEEKM